LALLNPNTEIPKIFHKSLEELNDIESVQEEVDFITARKIITRRGSNDIANGINDEVRPLSDAVTIRNFERSHKRIASDPNRIQSLNITKNESTGKHVEFADKRTSFARTISQIESSMSDFGEVKDKTHRRTKSSIPYGVSTTSQPQRPEFQRLTSNRSSTREFYAAPSYTPSALLERKETMMEKKELETFIDILDYCAQSPDEKALVEACARLGIIYLNDNNDIYTLRLRTKRKIDGDLIGMSNSIENDNDIAQYKRLQVLEFTSDRKRMSVIVMDKFGQIWLICKGAESHVLPLCKSTHLVAQTQNHINEFAKQGLRTLALAKRKMTKTEFINFNNELMEANSSLTNRAEKVELCQRKIETGLELLGATAVEDALQDNVKDTLESLRKAGIKVWVLTGDKVETALNIALSCGHISEDAGKYFIVECVNELQLNGHLDALERELQRNTKAEYALLIDGYSLAIALDHFPERFRDLAYKCHAVLCCRLSPLQKCEVVHLVKTVADKPVTGESSLINFKKFLKFK
jgi:phospholipid-translocating ATPase